MTADTGPDFNGICGTVSSPLAVFERSRTMQALTYSALLRESAGEQIHHYSSALLRNGACPSGAEHCPTHSVCRLRCQILMSMEMSLDFTECVSAPEEM